ncbi:gliding motility-associated C-terminal domain-containing protein [Flavobacterium sp. CYK-4]|uniref:T9SS type B sorting domain-containing protein n=1 Tax=Flavobacterium lotistagni TaxID=2709660 RepID=UPI0014073FBF|nr:gliding motility-associated C-terminal domain-containing protein [Flavobacterium lotistagni]NHM07489.1 gliding motility-associated C-terminal domain-containing protein [Flavobacterium lotistagni]
MKKVYFTPKSNNLFCGYFLQIFLLLAVALTTQAQVRVPFTQRTSQYTPTKKIYNVKGDFTMIGNTNLTLQNYGDNTANSNNQMVYVDVDGNSNNGVDGKRTFNSSSATLSFSTENGAVPSCSNIIYAGLYWTGRSSDGNSSSNSFSVTKNNVTKTFDKRNISLKGPNSSTYTQFTASANDIYYPTSSDGYMYSAYKEVTDYVRANGIGEYTAADIALVEGDGGDIGFYGGWSLIVVYENTKMKYRDVTIFDGHAYVTGGATADFEIPVSGFNTVQSGPVGMKLGMMAGEGDRRITGDFFQIKRQSDNTFVSLTHGGNSSTNFFNSSIETGGNARNPSLLNNTGLDISMFNISNPSNTVLTNNQTSTTFKYGSTQDTYIIFAIAMAVDAYIPEVENVLTATTINGTPVTTEPYISLPGQDVGFNIDIKNLGTEAINNYKVVVPIPYNASYVPGSAVGTILFTPAPSPNTVTFDPTLGATGSIVWNMGTLPLGATPSTLLAKLSFKLKTTTDCSILLNATCGSPIYVTASSSGTGAITGITFNGTRAIKGYTQNGACVGQPINETLAIKIDGSAYVAANCANTPLIREFGYCNSGNSIGTSVIAGNFPPGSTFYNEFPVTLNAIQYTDSNPIPLVAGSTITYYAVPPNTTGCVFPFRVTKCKLIIAENDAIGPINGTTGSTNAGNIFNNNGSGLDTLGGSQVQISQVNLTVTTPATPINGGPVPSIDLTNGNIVVPVGTPAGTYTITYQICEKTTPTNCDSAVVTITVTAPAIVANNDTYNNINCAAVGIVGNVLANDSLNGTAPTTALVNFTVLTGSNPNINIDALGNVTVSSGIAAGTYTYTYRICQILNPSNCATASITVTITENQTTPVFTLPSSICAGAAAPVLPTTSNNGINGTWTPATVSNTTSGTYTFTPSAGQCANQPITKTITVNAIAATFNPIAPICAGATAPVLPTTSNNGVTGTWSPSTVDNTATGTYTFTPDAGQCATAAFVVTITVNQLVPTFNGLDTEICSGDTAPVLPLVSSNGIFGTWSPATVSNTATGTYTFTPNAGQCATAAFVVTVTVNQLVPTFNGLDTEICAGDTAPVLPLVSSNGISGTWSPSTVDNTATGTYTFTPDAGQCATAAFVVTITVNQLVPTFNGLDTEICSGDTAPVLPLVSSNGIAGTWSPSTVDNTTTGTYTFTPDAGQCATAAFVVTVTVNQLVPTFNGLDTEICSGDTAPVLPLVSSNGISGTWSPSTVDNTTTGTYTFTPDAGQCATAPFVVTITVNPLVAVFIDLPTNICSGDVAPVLPTTSTNGVAGTWNPSTVSNTTSGTYTFTPNTGQCATAPFVLNFTVNATSATFNPIAAICAGGVAPVLPTTSNNGVNGTWNPATVDNTTSGTYVFTPDAGQCATGTTTSLSITVNPTSASFNPIAPICAGDVAPILPTTSANGVTGTWNPATVDNTATASYTFTPDAGQCATANTTSITVFVNATSASFSPIAPICAGEVAPVLPTTSANGVTGTWNPATVSNTASGTYTFTPDAGQCATSPVALAVTVNATVATFDPIAPICPNDVAPVLPTTSTNGVTGTWNPAIVDTTTTATYTFTPDPGQCASGNTTDLTITVNGVLVVESDDADCNNDSEVTFDLNNYLPTGIPNDGSWTDVDNTGGLIGTEFSPYLVDVGTYTFRYEVMDDLCQRVVEVRMTVDDNCAVLEACPLLDSQPEKDVRNGFSPNGDNINEEFIIRRIDNLECFPTNTVEIYNRWGILVYETKQYDNKDRVFTGTSEGRVTVAKSSELPAGTYFYVVNYTDKEGNNHHLEGYVYLTR